MPRVAITIADNQPQPYRFTLDRKLVTIGRGSENDIAIHCPSVSVRHAVMERTDAGFCLRDLDSTNGTQVDGVRESIIPLRDGSVVKLGDVTFDFQLSEEEKAALGDGAEETLEKVAQAIGGRSQRRKDAVEGKKPAPRRQPQAAVPAVSPLQSAAMFFCFLILAVIAFYVGLSLRHQKETGRSLLETMASKGKKAETEVAPSSELPDNSVPTTADEK